MIALEVSTTGLISTTVIAFLVLLLILVAVILFAKAK
jgi:Na+-transporting NADH:ubiquinone oxidoreductase subunit F